MSLLPTIPRDPVARFRLLAFWFALFAAGGHMISFATASEVPTVPRLVGFTACAILGAWFVWGYRRGGFPEFSTPFEAALLVAAGASAAMPLRAMGLFFAAIQLRALYATRREFALLPISYGIGRALSIALAALPSPYAALSLTVALQVTGLVFISGTFFLLMLALERQAETERALQRSEERYRVLAAATHDMVYDWNVATGTVEHTDAIRGVFGYTEAEVVRDRRWWLSRIHPEDRTEYDAVVAARFADPAKPARPIQYRVRRADDSEAIVEENAVVQRDDSGAPVRVIGSVREISAQHQLEVQLRQAQKMEAVGQLAGGVAHDFNNLLTVIAGHVFMLEQSHALNAEASRQLAGITRAAERAGSLTRQLLAFGRKQFLKPTVLDLNAVIRDVDKLIAPVVGERIRVVTNLDPALSPILADAGQLEQVLINLAINARDAMPDGGTLAIATTHVTLDSGLHVQLTLADTGLGMDAATVSRLFEPFFTTKVAGKGTGLGLATAYGIIKQSSGDILVESAPGKGSTFTIVLPVAAKPLPAPPVELPATLRPIGARRVLLVEDDEGVRDFAREVLTRAGLEVVQARDGVDGLGVAKAMSYAIDMVVTDVVMPRMGGRQMVEQLRAVLPDLPVLFISGYADDAQARRELGAGEIALLEKPFSARTLRDAVAGAANLTLPSSAHSVS
jgi:two-component system cell cycle sensor histidine kinase/response regulator CckA